MDIEVRDISRQPSALTPKSPLSGERGLHGVNGVSVFHLAPEFLAHLQEMEGRGNARVSLEICHPCVMPPPTTLQFINQRN